MPLTPPAKRSLVCVRPCVETESASGEDAVPPGTPRRRRAVAPPRPPILSSAPSQGPSAPTDVSPIVLDPTRPGLLQDALAKPPSRKRPNTSKKGQQVELLAIKLLEAEGYLVHRCIRTGSKRGPLWISQSNDVFGCIDLVAKKLGERTRWIQVTADSGIGRKRKEMDEVPWDPQHDSVEIWRWVGGARRKHKTTGEWLHRQYFQIYHFDDGYALREERRVNVTPGNDTLSTDPYTDAAVEA